MISTIKGTIAELMVQRSILDMGYFCYTPVVDSGTDLLVELKNGSMSKVQIKGVHVLKGTSVEISTEKYMNKNKVDVVAVVLGKEINEHKDMIAYVPYENQRSINLALHTGKNNQNKGRNWFYQYDRFPEFS